MLHLVNAYITTTAKPSSKKKVVVRLSVDAKKYRMTLLVAATYLLAVLLGYHAASSGRKKLELNMQVLLGNLEELRSLSSNVPKELEDRLDHDCMAAESLLSEN